MHSIDRYLCRRYHPVTYNCAHLVCEVWEELRGPAMAHVLRGFLLGHADRHALLSDLRTIRFLVKPISPCVVLMQGNTAEPHVGVFIRGRILHCSPGRGTTHQDLMIATLGFSKVRFFTC